MAFVGSVPLVVDDCPLPRIRLQLPSSGPSIEISAQIVWLAGSKKSAGIRFVDLTAEARNQISNWIASEKPAPATEVLTPLPVKSLIPPPRESRVADPNRSGFLAPHQPPPLS